MAVPSTETLWPDLQRASRVVVVVDVVESVRLMQANEADVIDRWRRFVNMVRTQVLPHHGGRLVKSLGDGLLMEFETVSSALAASLDMQQCIPQCNRDRPAEEMLQLRVGVHVAEVIVDELDVYGVGVNLAARLAALGGPGDVVISAAARDLLIPGLDGEFEDLGDCFFKHIETAQRAFRVVSARDAVASDARRHSGASLLPSIAVIPFSSADRRHDSFAAVLADDLSAAMSRCPLWRVTSRLSTMPLARRTVGLADIARLLKIDFVVSGRLCDDSGALSVSLELASLPDGVVVWAARKQVAATVGGPQERLIADVVNELGNAVLDRGVTLGHVMAMPNLPGYALLLHSIGLLHRVSRPDVMRSREALEYLMERHPRAPEVRAWLAKWHVFQLAQAWSRDPQRDVAEARAHLARAVDAQPDHALSLTFMGHVAAFVDADQPAAQQLLEHALSSNPSEPLAWLFLSHVRACLGRHEEAVASVERAQSLSPVDPMAYFFDEIASSVYTAAGRHEDAVRCAERAVRRNALHLPSLARLVIAQASAGLLAPAALSAQRYLAIRPAASVTRFLERHAARHHELARHEADALLLAGIPL